MNDEPIDTDEGMSLAALIVVVLLLGVAAGMALVG